MIDLSHNLGLAVTAEGMEDQATLNALTKMGCDTAQGYVIARPMPAKDIYPLINQKISFKKLEKDEIEHFGKNPLSEEG